MSELLGTDGRRVDLIAERLREHSAAVQSLQTVAAGAVAEMRRAWGGQDLEHFAQRWDREARPRLSEACSVLAVMATALRAQADEQRRASGTIGGTDLVDLALSTGGSSRPQPLAPPGALDPAQSGIVLTAEGNRVDTSWSGFLPGHQAATGARGAWGYPGQSFNDPTAADHGTVSLGAGTVTLVDESLGVPEGNRRRLRLRALSRQAGGWG